MDNYRARSTSVALVNLSEIKKKERKVIVIASLAVLSAQAATSIQETILLFISFS